jgi:4-aminobutyrate aminotransferase and related aminotransferases
MQGIVLFDKNNGPDKKHTSRIYQNAMKNGLMMITAGTYGNVIRTLMPLTIKNDELDQSLEILSNALRVP